MTKNEAQAVRQVLMQILMQGGEVDTRGKPNLPDMKREAGCHIDLTQARLLTHNGKGAGGRVITEKGKQFILDMEES